MQLNIKKYESVNIYVLLEDNVIIGMYTNFTDANAAKLEITLDKETGVDKDDEYYIVNE